MAPRNLDRLNHVYGPATWDVYERLDGSLNPDGPDRLYELAGHCLRPDGIVLDAGCRNAEHLVRLVQTNQITGVGVDPVELHVELAHDTVATAGLVDRIALHHGVIHDLPYDNGHFDLVWCRDVLEQVDELDQALTELVRVMKPAARLLVYTTFATELLEGRDAEMMRRHLGNVEANLDADYVEAAFRAGGLEVQRRDIIGTEWREFAEERTRPVSRALLRLSRLRRQRDDIVAVHGEDIYDHIEANLHWEVFQFLGKLQPVVYVLGRK